MQRKRILTWLKCVLKLYYLGSKALMVYVAISLVIVVGSNPCGEDAH